MDNSINSKNHTRKPKVIVAHPHTQHSHFLAVGVQRAQCLEAYITQFYYKKSCFPFSLAAYLPRSYQHWLDKKLFNRFHPELDPKKVETLHTIVELIRVVINRLNISGQNTHERILLFFLDRFSHMVGKIAAKRADILIGTDEASAAAFRIAKGAGCICVLDLAIAHNTLSQRIYEEEAKLNPSLAPSTIGQALDPRWIENSLEEVKLADYFLVGSSFPKQSLIELGVEPEQIFTIPYGADTSRFSPADSPSLEDDNLRVLFVGTGYQRKGINYLLEAIHQLKPNYNISLTLCGSVHPTVQAQQRYIGDYSALGYVDALDVPNIYRQADVLVLPSLVEGFPRVCIEAMASGLPVVASTNTGLQDVITDGQEGFIIPIRDVEALKDRLIYLYRNPEKRVQMGKNAHHLAVNYFTWERYYQDVGRFIETVWLEHQKVRSS